MSGLEGLLAGRVLGDRYRIEEVIGRGGMGAVYRATDERLGRQVAVKVITVAGGADTEARDRLRARFYREARAAAALPHHPNVVPVYDYGSDATLHLDFIVMELLRGQDLATRLARSGPPPLATGIRILYEAARGVSVGHRSGLIHRDVKPGNIFLAEEDQGDVQVRVVDFGIAKLADEEDTLGQLTQDGRVPHSPAFASPEQLRGLSGLTPASDVFSLGAVGYTLLTGERPFSEADRNRMALGMPVPPPSLREHNPAIPSPVEALIRRALSFDPEDRQPDAGVMARELGDAMRTVAETPLEPYAVGGLPPRRPPDEDDDVTRVLDAAPPPPGSGDDETTRSMDADADDRTLLVPPPAAAPAGPEPTPGAGAGPSSSGIPPRAFPRREPRRRRIGGAIVWLLLLAVLAAAAYAIWTATNEPVRLPPAEPLERDSIPPPPDTIPTIVPETVTDTAGEQPELQALVLNREGRRLAALGQDVAAAENLRRATEMAPNSADYAADYAQTLVRLGRMADAAREFARAAELDPTDADHATGRGHALMRLGRTGEAAESFARAIELDPDRTAAHYNLGVARLSVGDTIGAYTALRRALELSETPAERAAAQREIRAIEQARARRVTGPDTLSVSRPGAVPVDTLPSLDDRPDATGSPVGR